jgi:hypothetical protein
LGQAFRNGLPEQTNISDDEIRIHATNHARYGFGRRHRPIRPDEQRRPERKLAVAVEDRRTRSAAHRSFANVAGHADNRRVRVLIPHVHRERLAEWVDVRKVSIDERLVDDESRRRIPILGVRKFASPQYGNAQRLEISRRDDPDGGARSLGARRDRCPKTMKRRAGPRGADDRQVVRGTSRIHSRQFTNRRQELLLKGNLALDGIARPWQRDLHCQEPMLLKAVVDARECGHRSHK